VGPEARRCLSQVRQLVALAVRAGERSIDVDWAAVVVECEFVYLTVTCLKTCRDLDAVRLSWQVLRDCRHTSCACAMFKNNIFRDFQFYDITR
jgi:hypothetical protein